MLKWTPQYAVGFQTIDRQHQQFFGIFNELYDSFLANKAGEVLEGVLRQLTNYAEFHFATEERYFKEFGYAGAAEHIEQHDAFRNQVNEFRKHYEREHDRRALAEELVDLLDNWLINHVVTMDQRYVECFKKHGLE